MQVGVSPRYVRNTLLRMYSACGAIGFAGQVFDEMPDPDVVSWSSMIAGYVDCNCPSNALIAFQQMQTVNERPNSVTLVSHLGLVYEGKMYFDKMVNVYNIRPRMEHYGCIVDMLGRAGMIEEAYNVIKNMPEEPNSVVLRSFASACRNHDNVVCVDKNMRELLMELEPKIGANYVMAASVSSLSDNWSEVARTRAIMKGREVRKAVGLSFVELILG